LSAIAPHRRRCRCLRRDLGGPGRGGGFRRGGSPDRSVATRVWFNYFTGVFFYFYFFVNRFFYGRSWDRERGEEREDDASLRRGREGDCWFDLGRWFYVVLAGMDGWDGRRGVVVLSGDNEQQVVKAVPTRLL